MKMSPSSKARLISFVAMWAVVAWHCYCGSRVERWFIPVFCYWSVPWFFLISGFFFVGSFEKRGLRGFITYKLKSLLVPYIIWCLVGFLVFILCSPGQIRYSISAVFALGQGDVASPAYNPPLWYIRTLLIFAALGGGTLQILKMMRIYNNQLKAVCFSLSFSLLLVLLIISGVKLGPLSSPAYFLSGVIIYYCNKKGGIWIRNCAERYDVYVGVVVLAIAIALRLVWFLQGHSFSSSGQGGVIIGNCSVIAVIIALWCLANREWVFTEKMWYMCAGLGVFVYLMHRPLLMCMLERFGRNLAVHDMLKDVIFVLLVALYAPFCLVIGWLFHRYMPKTYSVLIGGR